MKNIPNFLSTIRILLSLALLFLRPLGSAFYIVYILCGLSDALDGWLARRTNSTSSLGARLDSAADLMMTAVLLLILFPLLPLNKGTLLWLAAIAGIRLTALLIGSIRYRSFAALHTWLNKATGFGLFALPLLLPFVQEYILVYAICSVATAASLEELAIQITSRELELDRKSLFLFPQHRNEAP